ncbi:MAG TPA: hypothetical protein VHE30_01835 [Polyangiaceae bacterium]|nr:hypothetical protein [Polyangiaceae bacterium]
MNRWVSSLSAAVALAGLALVACERKPSPFVPDVVPDSPPAKLPTSGKKCVVHLHGKGGSGAPATVVGDVTHLRPAGNDVGWSGRQWVYFPAARLAEVRAIVVRATTDAACGRVVVHGFSNGAAAAAKLYCRGESLGDTVVGYVIDDPVPDHGVEPCRPRAGTKLALYSTGALSQAKDGWDCASADWTCEGGSAIGLPRYAAALKVAVRPSPSTKHEEHPSPPEERDWW